MKPSILCAALASVVAAGVSAPAAGADMLLGNYEVLSDRWANGGPSWIWALYPCEPGNPGLPGEQITCVRVSALPRPQRGAYYGGYAYRVGNTFSFFSPYRYCYLMRDAFLDHLI